MAIDKGIPISSPYRWAHPAPVHFPDELPFKYLHPGESFLVPFTINNGIYEDMSEAIGRRIYQFMKYRTVVLRFRTRLTAIHKEGGWRVWRLDTDTSNVVLDKSELIINWDFKFGIQIPSHRPYRRSGGVKKYPFYFDDCTEVGDSFFIGREVMDQFKLDDRAFVRILSRACAHRQMHSGYRLRFQFRRRVTDLHGEDGYRVWRTA